MVSTSMLIVAFLAGLIAGAYASLWAYQRKRGTQPPRTQRAT